MLADRPLPRTPGDGGREEGWARLVLESERLRLGRRARVRQAGAFVFVGALLVSFIALFLPHPAIQLSRLHHGSSEQLTVVVTVLLAYLAAGACMRWWSDVGAHALPAFAVAAGAAVAVCAAACGFVLAALDPELGPERLERWFGPRRMTRPPAIGPEAVAALRPALVVLLVLVLPPLLTATGSVLARRDRLRLERLEDDVRLAATGPTWSPAATAAPSTGAVGPLPQRHHGAVGWRPLTATVAPPASFTDRAQRDPVAAPADAEASTQRRRQLAVRTRRDRRRRARVRDGAIRWTVLLVVLVVLAVALPHGRGYWRSDLGGTVYALATGASAVAAFLILHGWARTRAASRRGLLAALLGAGALATACWWLTLRVIAGLRIRPEGLSHLREPEVTAEHDALYSPPVLVPQGSWQQAALLALPFILPVVLAAWDAFTDRRDFDRIRDLERLGP